MASIDPIGVGRLAYHFNHAFHGQLDFGVAIPVRFSSVDKIDMVRLAYNYIDHISRSTLLWSCNTCSVVTFVD